MSPEEYAGLGGLITIVAAALALVIKQLEQSRCSKINCLCVKCERTLRGPKDAEREPYTEGHAENNP
eukprot:SAG22_NODE_6404_length_860_cov_4.412615_2_plen_67_part_00